MRQEPAINVFYSTGWSFDSKKDRQDYELLDTGEGEKLERFGPHVFIRPLEEAVWAKSLGPQEWAKARGKFWSSKEGGAKGWKISQKIKDKWVMSYQGISFLAYPTPFRHL